MRVIAGKAKRLQLKTIPGMETRPTTDRIKETLFNMLMSDIYDVSFLDLFAGSGGIGIEALSRGARHAVFVDSNKKAADIIKDNLSTTHFSGQAEIYNMPVLKAVRRLYESNTIFDVVFMDPPYNKGMETEVLRCPEFYNILADDALIIIEASLTTEIDLSEIPGYTIIKEKLYKTNKHIFINKIDKN